MLIAYRWLLSFRLHMVFVWPQLYEKVRRSEQKYKVALDVLSYHNQATEEEVRQMCTLEVPPELPELIL